RGRRGPGPLERDGERFLGANRFRLELGGLLEQRERLVPQVVLEIELAEPEQPVGAIAHERTDALPRLQRLLFVPIAPVAGAELDQVLRIGARLRGQSLEQREAPGLFADALVEFDERRQDLLVVAGAFLERAEVLERALPIPALDERFGKPKDEIGIAGSRP